MWRSKGSLQGDQLSINLSEFVRWASLHKAAFPAALSDRA
jgi:hypothetical protein